MGYTINGAPPSSGSSLPAASGANEIPVSSGAGTTYVATGAAGILTIVRSPLVASYDFSSATGVTTTNGSAGGTASVTGGALALTCPSTPEARYYASFREAPRGSIALPLVDGRPPLRWRATARLKAISSLSVPRFLAKNVLTSTLFVGFYLAADGSLGAENNTSVSGYGTAAASSLPTNGTGWVEMECCGDMIVFRYGTGTTSVEPSTWTIVAVATVATQVFGTVELVNSTNGAPGSSQLTEWDNLTVSSW